MTPTEQDHLDTLLRIAAETPCPLTEWEAGFVRSLDRRRGWPLSEKQAVQFDQIVKKHVIGDEE